MYCPKYGHEMEITEEAYACRRGEMELSINVGRALEDYVRHASATTSAASSSVTLARRVVLPGRRASHVGSRRGSTVSSL